MTSLPVPEMRAMPGQDRWCVHSYYTLNPWAPDGSGRLLVAGADLNAERAEVLILSPEGDVLDRFGDCTPPPSYWHTGLWQSWGADARHVYYQCGSLQHPRVARRDLATGDTVFVDQDLEGIPSSGEPGLAALHGMLYAAGYSHRQYRPQDAPVPFQARDRHGLFSVTFDPPVAELVLSTAEVLARSPNRERLLAEDRRLQGRFGSCDGLTLMCYCVRWNTQGTRCLFYFGNHCVSPSRGEPRIASIWTLDRNFRELHLAADFSFGRGVHWGWHPDGEHLVGYGPIPGSDVMGLALVHYTGADYRIVSRHNSGGHPSISPIDHNLLVTDSYDDTTGLLEFIDLRSDRLVAQHRLPRKHAGAAGGRHPGLLDLHPVFHPEGHSVLVNTLPGRHGVPMLIEAPLLD